MSRIQKYKESLHKFIKDKSCLMENSNEYYMQLNNLVYNKIKNNDLMYPILLLTIMNNQNKKNHISMQGYFIASSIEFLCILIEVIENKSDIVSKLGNDSYNKITNMLIINANKSLQQNMESVKNPYQNNPQLLVNIMINSMAVLNSTLKLINTFDDFKFITTDQNCNSDIINWYLKTDKELINKFKSFKQVSKESMQEYIEKKHISMCELSIVLGWIIGGGNIKALNKFKKSAKYFATMHKISKDFENLTSDIKSSNGHTSNYVLNYGLQDSYEIFLSNKEKFIEESMIEDVYTNTIKEIIDTIEDNVDMIIEQTSPDLKSNYSSKK